MNRPTLFVVALTALPFLAFTGRSWGDVRTKLIASDAQSPGGVWVEEARFTGTDSQHADFFGVSVSIAGDRAAVGAYQPFRETGTAYVFRRVDNGTPFQPGEDFWVLEVKFIPPSSPSDNGFGISVSLSGDRLLVGAVFDDDACPGGIQCDSGAAYVYRRDDSGTPQDPSDDFWVEEAKLTASDAARFDHFGGSVALYGDRAVVGASTDDDACPSDPVCDSGSAYVFRLDDNGSPNDPADDFWIEEAKLTASDAAAGDLFGGGVSLSAARAVVGASRDDDACPQDPICNSGSVYVFRRDDNGTPNDPVDDLWIEEAKLTASDAEAGDKFGLSVSIGAARVVVGAFLHDGACPSDPVCNSGSAYVFRRAGFIWVEEAEFTDEAPVRGDHFGKSVCMGGAGNRLIVGSDPALIAPGEPNDPEADFGSAHVFRRSDNDTPSDSTDDFWTREAKLVSSDLSARDAFGTAVAIGGNRAVVGALLGGPLPDGPLAGGAAYIFATSGNGPAIPAVSQWGVVVMFLLVLSTGTMVVVTRRAGFGRTVPGSERRCLADKE